MSRGVRILILMGALAILVGVYFIAQYRPFAPEPESVASAEDDTIRLVDQDPDEIQRVELENKNGGLVLTRKTGEPAAEELPWETDYPHTVNLRQTEINSVLHTMARLSAEKLIAEDPEDPSIYGLDEPAAVARAVFEGGRRVEFRLGDTTPTGTGYYMQLAGDPAVYMIRRYRGNHFLYTVHDLRDMRLPSIDPEKLTYLYIDGETTIEALPNDPDEERLGLFSSYSLHQPYQIPRPVDSEKFGNLTQQLASFRMEEVVTDAPADLSDYGLDPPRAEVLARDEDGNEVHFLIGSDTGEAMVYVKQAGEPTVFTLRRDTVEFITTDPFAITDKFALIINIDYVDRLVIDAGGERYEAVLERTTVEGQDEDDVNFTLNGNPIEDEAFRKFYQTAIGLLADARNPDPKPSDPEVTLTYYLNREDVKQASIQLVPFDRDFYAVYRDGVSEFLVSRRQVAKMLQSAQALLSSDDGDGT